MTDYSLVERKPTVEEFNGIRQAAGLSIKNQAAAEKGIANSLFSACILFQGKCIGIGRVVGDGGLVFDIVDVAVLPEHQGKGLGKQIMESLMVYIRSNASPTAFISLMTEEKLAEFYQNYKFKVRGPSNPGMYQVIP